MRAGSRHHASQLPAASSRYHGMQDDSSEKYPAVTCEFLGMLTGTTFVIPQPLSVVQGPFLPLPRHSGNLPRVPGRRTAVGSDPRVTGRGSVRGARWRVTGCDIRPGLFVFMSLQTPTDAWRSLQMTRRASDRISKCRHCQQRFKSVCSEARAASSFTQL